MDKVGIFFGPEGGATEKIAKMIQNELGSPNADLIPISSVKAEDISRYKNIIFGSSTLNNELWNLKRPKRDWENFIPELDRINYDGKIFALYGLGDHICFAKYFVDSMGVIGKRMMLKNAKIVGSCDANGYKFENSEAFIDGRFIGLPVDEEYESQKSLERVKNWVKVIKKDFI